MDYSSSSLSSQSSKVSSKVSSSSVSSSTKIASSSSGLSSSMRGLSTDVDELMAVSASARDTARGFASNLGALTSDLGGIDDMLASSGINSSSSSSLSSSNKKLASRISSISQSSMEMGDGFDGSVKSSVKSSSSSTSSASMLQSKQVSVDGELVSSETVAERASKQSESQKEKVVQDGQVLTDTGFKMEQTSAAKLKATKEMSQEELDSFFRQNAIQGKPAEALNFDKDKNLFEAKLNDLAEFSPQELTVKIIDGVITVYGTHVDKTDENNYQTHEYVRRFTVPKDLKADNVGWQLEPSGVLAIKAGDGVKPGFSECHLDCTIFKPRSFFKKVTAE